MSRGFWKKFLIDAGIPVRAADSYTSSFVENRITESMVPDLSKSVLIDLGITIIGDVIAILKHAILVTEEASVEKRNSKKQSRSDRRRSSSERSEKKSKKPEPEKKVETAPAVKKVEDKSTGKTRDEKTIIKVGHNTDKKPSQPPPRTEKAPRKVRITDQALIKETSLEETKSVPPHQVEVKRVKLKKEVQSVRTVSTKPGPKTKRTVSSASPKVSPVMPDKPSITQLVKKVAPHVKHVTPMTASIKNVTPAVKNVTTLAKPHVTSGTVKHVTIREEKEQRSRPVVHKTHLEKRQPVAMESEDSDTSIDERSPVARRVFGGKPSRDTEVVSREVTEAVSRDVEEMSRDSSSGADSPPPAPVIVRRPAKSYSPVQPTNNEPVITRLLPEEPRRITRSLSGNVMRTVQTVRCVSPDSTTDTPPPKPKQTTTIILNTKGKCSVRPVSPPLDMMVERKRKVMPRNDGKTTLTRVVQRHLDSSSPHRSPKRNKVTPPARNQHKQIGSLNSEKNNSFRSDAEESELRQNNKFRSEHDSFDIVPEKRTQIRRRVRTRSYSGGRGNTSLSKRLGSVRGSDLRKSFPARVGGVAARVFSDSRLSQNGTATERLKTSRRPLGSFRSGTTERSVFSRLGD